MPVFISYSHGNSAFVDKLAVQLVKHRAQVWLDRWELNVGDSLIQRVQDAVSGASALIVVLSKASVASEWVRKELSVGLIRELEERRVVVLPVLIEDCDIPLFLRDKKYADFRDNFDVGLGDVLKAIAKTTTDTRSRIEQPEWHVDWAIDWYRDDQANYTITIVEQAVDKPYSCLTVIRVRGNEQATGRYDLYGAAGFDWLYRQIVVSTLADAAREADVRIVLYDPQPQRRTFGVRDKRLGIEWKAEVECRLLGDDTGADVLLDVGGQLKLAVAEMRNARRPITDAEQKRLDAILATLK